MKKLLTIVIYMWFYKLLQAYNIKTIKDYKNYIKFVTICNAFTMIRDTIQYIYCVLCFREETTSIYDQIEGNEKEKEKKK